MTQSALQVKDRINKDRIKKDRINEDRINTPSSILFRSASYCTVLFRSVLFLFSVLTSSFHHLKN